MRLLAVLSEKPPNFASIVAVFPEASKPGVMFAYDGRIYAPGLTRVRAELQIHEQIHVERQGNGSEKWWERYLIDTTFRLEEELLAHRAEYRAYCQRHSSAFKQRTALINIAGKLSSPLYGSMITVEDASKGISL